MRSAQLFLAALAAVAVAVKHAKAPAGPLRRSSRIAARNAARNAVQQADPSSSSSSSSTFSTSTSSCSELPIGFIAHDVVRHHEGKTAAVRADIVAERKSSDETKCHSAASTEGVIESKEVVPAPQRLDRDEDISEDNDASCANSEQSKASYSNSSSSASSSTHVSKTSITSVSRNVEASVSSEDDEMTVSSDSVSEYGSTSPVPAPRRPIAPIPAPRFLAMPSLLEMLMMVYTWLNAFPAAIRERTVRTFNAMLNVLVVNRMPVVMAVVAAAGVIADQHLGPESPFAMIRGLF